MADPSLFQTQVTDSSLLPFGSVRMDLGDDNRTAALDITPIFENGFRFGGGTYNGLAMFTNGYINFAQNGAISFNRNIGQVGAAPIIAPLEADLDSREAPAGVTDHGVYFDLNMARDSVVITWKDVGNFFQDVRDPSTFQVEIVDLGNEDAEVIFRYQNVDNFTFFPEAGLSAPGGGVNEIARDIVPGLESFEGNTGITGVWQYRIIDGRLQPEDNLGENATGTAADELFEGTPLVDVFDGGAGNDTISAGLGNDVVDGGAGDDSILGSSGRDTLRGGDGDDFIGMGEGGGRAIGGEGNDTIQSADTGNFNDIIDAMGGDDFIFAGSGRDTIAGHDGNDTIYGAAGTDFIYGGAGDDFLDGGADFSTDFIEGMDGNDLIRGGAGRDQLAGQGGNDTVVGGEGDDEVFGGDGDDVLIGGDIGFRGDTLVGGEGDDFIWAGNGSTNIVVGGDGADRFFVDGGTTGNFRINDYDASEGDVIILDGEDFLPGDLSVSRTVNVDGDGNVITFAPILQIEGYGSISFLNSPDLVIVRFPIPNDFGPVLTLDMTQIDPFV